MGVKSIYEHSNDFELVSFAETIFSRVTIFLLAAVGKTIPHSHMSTFTPRNNAFQSSFLLFTFLNQRLSKCTMVRMAKLSLLAYSQNSGVSYERITISIFILCRFWKNVLWVCMTCNDWPPLFTKIQEMLSLPLIYLVLLQNANSNSQFISFLMLKIIWIQSKSGAIQYLNSYARVAWLAFGRLKQVA